MSHKLVDFEIIIFNHLSFFSKSILFNNKKYNFANTTPCTRLLPPSFVGKKERKKKCTETLHVFQ